MFAVIREILDFFLKAAARYVTTPEGQKEWRDIKDAAEGAARKGDDDLSAILAQAGDPDRNQSSVSGRVRTSGESGTQSSVPPASKRSGKRV